MIRIEDYCALSYLNMLGKSYMKHGMAYSIDHRIDRIYSYYPSHKEEAKVYAIAKSVAAKIGLMDTSSLTADAILSLTRTNEGSIGTVLDPMGESTKVSFNYLILPDLILMEVFEGEFSRKDSFATPDGKLDDTKFSRHFVGSVVISPSGIDFTPNTAIELMAKPEFREVSIAKEYAGEIFAISACIKKIPKGHEKLSINELIDKFPFETRVLKSHFINHQAKTNILQYAFKCFLYLHTSQTIRMEYIADGLSSQKPSTISIPRGYIQVDSLWDAEVHVINPFSVRGHFTHQPYGRNRALRKLIYIEEYIKSGYHRRATKDIVSKSE